MDALGFASSIHTYRQNLSIMRESNDPNGSESTNLCSLVVVDLDLTVCPDVFGLKAFDEKMPVTRMLPGSSPCDLRLLIPDTKIGQDGFHDVVIENLIGTATWRSRHVSPSDVIALRRRWPQAVFQVMKKRSVELRRQAYAGLQTAYRYTGRGYCPVCDIRTEHSLDSHMMCYHLDWSSGARCGKAPSGSAGITSTRNMVIQKHWILIRCRSRSQHGPLHVISGNGHCSRKSPV